MGLLGLALILVPVPEPPALGAAGSPDKLVVTPRVEALGAGRGRLILSFKPDPRYDFNRTPPLSVEVQPAPGLRWDQIRQTARDGKPPSGSPYFGQILPVEFTFSRDGAGPGQAEVKVTYFYCSKKDGYCARESRTLVVPLAPGS
jgi:hypothetical protein